MKAALLFLSLMELAKLHLVSSYCFLALGRPAPWPLGPLSLAFFLALVLGRALHAAGKGRLARSAFQALGLAAFSSAAYLCRLSSPLVFAWIAAFWIRGAWLGGRSPSNAFCVARFDEGIGLFLFAFLAAALVHVENAFARALVIPFFLFGILALGISKGAEARRGGLSPRSRAAALLSATALSLLAAWGLLSVLPALMAGAGGVGNALKGQARRLEPYLGPFLRSLLGFHIATASAEDTLGPSGALAPSSSPPDGGGFGAVFATFLAWAFLAVLAAFALRLLLLGLARFFRFLSSRLEGRASGRLRAFFLRSALLLSRFATLSLRRPERRSEARATYARLLVLGRRAGAPRAPSETPREYARRLVRSFPRSAAQAGFVAEAVEKEVYGGESLDPATVGRLVEIRSGAGLFAFQSERVRRAISRTSPRRDGIDRPGKDGF
jgi:hypothetical protein